MKSRNLRRLGVLLLPALMAASSRAGEPVVSENFEKFDLAKLPANWAVEPATAASELSIGEDAAKGKVLRINHAAADGKVALAVTVDVSKARGGTIRASVSGKCAGSFTPAPEKYGYPQLVILVFDAGGNAKGTISGLQPNSNDWQDLTAKYAIPADAASAKILCRIQECAADVLFDGLTVEVVPGVPQQADVAVPVPPPQPPPPQPPPPPPPPPPPQKQAALVSEDFEKFDLAKLPDGFSINPAGAAAELSIADDAAKGKVLRINHAAAPGEAGIAFVIDGTKARGGTVKASVFAKAAAAFVPDAGKYGFPQLAILSFDAGGNGNGTLCKLEGSGGWVELKATYTVPANSATVKILCRVQHCAADVSFDGLTIEVEGGAAPIAQGGKDLPAKPVAPLPPEAQAVQKKGLEDDGILYGPEVYVSEKAAHKSSMTASSFAIVGPGLPNTDLEAKPPAKWTVVPAKEMAGTSPEKLNASLPAFIVKNKPEIVILVGENKLNRKLPQNESAEWEDLIKICARFGAVPILAIPADAKSELRKEMLEAADATKCAVLELRAPMDKRMRALFELIEKNIFGRTPPPPETKPGEE